ncbi:MAG: 50S ribosomal protein L6 [Polyangiaceae bacterium]
MSQQANQQAQTEGQKRTADAKGKIPDLRQARIGKRPVAMPKGVTATLTNGVIEVKGPKGNSSRKLPPNVDVKIDGSTITVMPTIGGRDGARFQGLARALINAMVVGSGTGYVRTLELRGTGYRAEIRGTAVNLSLGFSHQILHQLPAGIKVEIPGDSKGTILVLSGADKEKMGETAATIRGYRPPEPYGGKGVRYQGEKVREKAGKAGKAGK